MKIRLEVVGGPNRGQSFTFDQHDTFIVGRGRSAHLRLPPKDKFFSRNHFMIELNPPLCRLSDMASTNGTYVNNRQTLKADLQDGDVIRGGDTVITLRFDRMAASDGPDALPVVDRTQRETPEDNALPPPHTFLESKEMHLGGGTLAPEDKERMERTVREGPPRLPNRTEVEPNRQQNVPLLATTREHQPPLADRDRTKPFPLDDYHLLRELGRGAMGVVYLARHAKTQTLVALKTIKPAEPATDREVEYFLREANILEQLNHPNIVSFHDMGRAAGKLYFSMEYVDGIDLDSLLQRERPLDVRRASRIVCQLLSALEHAHRLRFVHRDIKPSNLLISDEQGVEYAKLSDFGLARVYQASRCSGLTMEGAMGGSLAFMPPEQITNFRDAIPASDVYSAAATMYTMLTGEYIYDFPETMSKCVLMILQEPPIPITKRRSKLPRGLVRAIHRALSREPSERFASAQEFQDAVRPFAGA